MEKNLKEYDFLLDIINSREIAFNGKEPRKINWNKLLQIGAWHNVNPLIYMKLKYRGFRLALFENGLGSRLFSQATL